MDENKRKKNEELHEQIRRMGPMESKECCKNLSLRVFPQMWCKQISPRQ